MTPREAGPEGTRAADRDDSPRFSSVRTLFSSRPAEAFWRLCFLLIATWIVAFSLSPFDFSVSLGELAGRMRTMFVGGKFGGAAVAVIHFCSFAAAGFIGYNAHRGWLEKQGKWKFILLVVAGCSALELAKLWNPVRHPLALELGVKITGAVFGAIIGAKAGPWLRSAVGKWGGCLAGAAALLVLGVWWWIGLRPLDGGLKLAWSPEFRLLAGGEANGSRIWDGTVHELAIYDRAIDGGEKPGDPLVRYRVQGSPASVKPEGSLAAEPALVMEEAIGGESDLRYLASRGAAEPLTRAILNSGAFSIAVKMETRNLTQTGPARIVSLSKDYGTRNFTLGQDGRILELRVANGANGDNGAFFALRREVVSEGMMDVVATYDHGVSEMFLNGERLPGKIDLREPWYYLPVAKGMPARWSVIALFVISFVVPAMFVLRRKSPVVLFLCGALPFAVCSFAGGPWNLFPFVALLVAMAIVVPLAVRYVGIK